MAKSKRPKHRETPPPSRQGGRSGSVKSRLYEAAVNDIIGKCRMLALCPYSLARCAVTEIMDAIRNHEFALVCMEGEWGLIENAIPTLAGHTEGK